MENSLKQRIIGAVVLVALAVIFLPAILKEKTSSGTFVSKIPDKPEVLEEYRVDSDKIEKLKSQQQQAEIANLQEQAVASGAETSGQSSGNSAVTQTASSGSTATSPEQAVAGQTHSGSSENANQQAKSQDNAQGSSSPTRKTKSKRDPSQNSGASEIAEKADTDKPPANAEKVKKQPTQASSQNKETISKAFKSAAWVVQVASFSNESNATKLVDKLKQNQFKAYRRKVVSNGKTVYRVFVGPYIDKTKAQKAAPAITMVSETNVVLRVFDPVKH